MAQLLTAEEVAAQLRVSPHWLYARVRTGQFPAVRCGRAVRFRQADVDNWIEDHLSNTPPKERP